MASKNAELKKYEIDSKVKLKKITQFSGDISKSFNLLILLIGSIIILYFIKETIIESIKLLSGEETNTITFENYLANFQVSVLLVWGAGIGGIFYGLRERRSRIKSTKQQAEQITLLKSLIDPKKQSSSVRGK